MFGLSPRPKTKPPALPPGARTVEARRHLLAAISAAESGTPGRLAQLRARVEHAQAREAQARRDLEGASLERAQLEGEQLAASAAAERQVVTLRHALAAGAPEEIATMQRDIAALIDAARQKARTVLTDGYQGLDGRRATLVATNTDTITAFLLAARQVIAELEALKVAEIPDLEQLGPVAELSIPAAEFEAVGRSVGVPTELAELYAEIAGVASPKPLMSPGEARETEWAVARAATRRWSGEPWR